MNFYDILSINTNNIIFYIDLFTIYINNFTDMNNNNNTNNICKILNAIIILIKILK